MENTISIFLILPFLGFLAGVLVPENREKLLYRLTITTLLLHLIAFLGVTANWIVGGCEPLSYDFIEIYKSDDFRFDIALYFDQISAVYMGVGVTLTLLVGI